jgi:hypothetical protein
VRREIRQMTPGEANLSGTIIYVTHDKTVESGPLGPTLLSDTTETPAPNQQEQHLSHKKSSLQIRISWAQSTTHTCSPISQSKLTSSIPHFLNKKPQQIGAHDTNNTDMTVAHEATKTMTDMK